MLALSIRQPYAELILRGIKTIEYRSRATTIVGERFWIYASKGKPSKPLLKTRPIVSDNLSAVAPPPWMTELATALRLFPDELPTGVLVGSAVIERVERLDDWPVLNTGQVLYAWHLTGIRREKKPRAPKGHPQPVWWRPG